MSQDEANQIVRAAQRRRRMLRPPMKVLLPTAAALGAGAAIAVASIPDSGGVINGCYATNTNGVTMQPSVRIGALRVIDPSLPHLITGPVGTPTTTNYAAVCLPDETSVTWNQTGPTGPTGPTGAPGGPGTPGQQGAAGAAGTNLVGQTSFGLSGGGNTFLKIEGIKGESKDKLHPDEIELDSVAFTVNGGGAGASGGGGGAGKVAVHDISFTHKVDKASPAPVPGGGERASISEGDDLVLQGQEGQGERLLGDQADERRRLERPAGRE